MEDELFSLAAVACQCRRPRPTTHMTLELLLPLLVLIMTLHRGAVAMCPARCQCNDETLHAACTQAGLQVVPIQLNPELRHINLSYNKISNVHFTLEIYANLINLDLSHNRIQKLGSNNFMSQTHMVTLNVSHNEIESLDKDTFKGLRSLNTLDISSNHLEDISVNAFNELGQLEFLLLNDNKMVSFEPDLFKHQTNLKVLQLDDNQLLEIPADNLQYTGNLQKLSMSRNLVAYVEEGALPTLNHLKYLALDSNVIVEIHGSAFDSFSALEVLNLADNNFTSVPTTQLSKLASLVELNLSGNFFAAVPPVAFRGLFKLRRLYLSGVESLQRIDVRAFVDNINLEAVSMNDNIDLSAIPTRLFHGNPRLKRISMRNNMLHTLEATHFPLDQLAVLHIAGNPLHCNCSLMWLWKLVTEQKMSIQNNVQNNNNNTDTAAAAAAADATGAGVEQDNETEQVEMVLDVDGIKCAGPEKLTGLLLMDAHESDIRCSPNWLAVATGSGTAACVLAVVFIILLYSGVFRRCTSRSRSNTKTYLRREHTSHDIASSYPSEPTSSDRQRTRDKCEHMMGPPLLSEYQTLPTWENYPSYPSSKDIDLYRQFGYHTNSSHHHSRPHVVYV